MVRAQWKMESQIDTIYLVASESGLRSLYFSKVEGVPLAKSLSGAGNELKILRDTVSQLEQYFKGKRQDFDLPLELEGSEFQKKVWNQLKKIPYGKTYSYRELAQKVKNEKACRAVGSANGKNPIGIIIPCHRVIAADGSLGGYSGGLPNKVKLLELEKQHL
ncbi:MAG: methylated-DNA--[protein]-cysteine S-methyltransferase [Bdellovibrionota bacterium]